MQITSFLCCTICHMWPLWLYHMWPVWLYHIFLHYAINCTIFGQDLLNIKMCGLIFSATFVCYVSHSKNNSVRYCNNVHSCQQKSIGLKFSKSQTGSDVWYSCHHNSSLLLSPYLRIRAVSLSSIRYNQSHRVYINRRRQYIFLI